MPAETHASLATFIWSICNLLRGPYKRNEYRKVILPMTVLRRFECTGAPFCDRGGMTLEGLLASPGVLAENVSRYIASFSAEVREIIARFGFERQIARMAEKGLLGEVVKKFAAVDLSPGQVDNVQMGYVFEELIRIGAEQANEEAGEHFTPREVIKLMVNLLLAPAGDPARGDAVVSIYDPACGTGGMLSVAELHLRALRPDVRPRLFGQDCNDESWAICRADMLIKGGAAHDIVLGDSFTQDGFDRTFDYMLANPPFGVEWKPQQAWIEQEAATLGFKGRFGAGLPRINDGSLLFLQHMIAKMRPPADGGSRIGIVFNGSPLFSGDAGSGESSIRQWIIEQDWLDAVVALPDQLFYNTVTATYVWILTNRKEPRRVGKVQLIDGRRFFVRMARGQGYKRCKLGDPADRANEPDQIGDLTHIYGNFCHGETRRFVDDDPNGGDRPVERVRIVSKVLDNAGFGFRKIVVERPLRLRFQVTDARLARLGDDRGGAAGGGDRQAQREPERRREMIELLRRFRASYGERVYRDRDEFFADLRESGRAVGMRLTSAMLKMIERAVGEHDEAAAICRDREGRAEPDPALRDTENVPLTEQADDYLAREVLPHHPDAWIDHAKTRIGYEIPFNRHFYAYEPPRPLQVIEADIRALEQDIRKLLDDVVP